MNDKNPGTDQTNLMYWLHAQSPLHVGTGRGVGLVDLPVTREATTNWPLVPGSSTKGVVAEKHDASETQRESNEDDSDDMKQRARLRKLAFGSTGNEHSNAGSLVFTDAHLVCLPVRSVFGTFAWCTCPLALARLKRDLERAGLANGLNAASKPESEGNQLTIHVPDESQSLLSQEAKVFFEDLDLTAVSCENAATWADTIATQVFLKDEYWQTSFRKRFAIVPDQLFTYLTETATQIDARIHINSETGVVEQGQLWYEESLPCETILAGRVWCDRVYASRSKISVSDLFNTFCESMHLQIGGNASVGRGQVAINFSR